MLLISNIYFSNSGLLIKNSLALVYLGWDRVRCMDGSGKIETSKPQNRRENIGFFVFDNFNVVLNNI